MTTEEMAEHSKQMLENLNAANAFFKEYQLQEAFFMSLYIFVSAAKQLNMTILETQKDMMRMWKDTILPPPKSNETVI